jgi:phosphoglycolate phosphatase-like HAD superfamily hydrolase
MVGDSARDLLAGQSAGCRGCVLVRSGHAVADALPLLRDDDHVATDLGEGARLILSAT